jgi:hypothetical protein
MGQERPHDPCILVRQRYRRHVLVPPAHQLSQPALWLGFVLGKTDDRSRTVNHQGAQVSVATLADAQQILLATTGVLPRHQSRGDPRCRPRRVFHDGVFVRLR